MVVIVSSVAEVVSPAARSPLLQNRTSSSWTSQSQGRSPHSQSMPYLSYTQPTIRVSSFKGVGASSRIQYWANLSLHSRHLEPHHLQRTQARRSVPQSRLIPKAQLHPHRVVHNSTMPLVRELLIDHSRRFATLRRPHRGNHPGHISRGLHDAGMDDSKSTLITATEDTTPVRNNSGQLPESLERALTNAS